MQFKKRTNSYEHTHVYGVAKFYHIYMHILHNALHLLSKCIHSLSMVIRVVKFSSGGTKIEGFLPKNQWKQTKILNFENWCNGKL